MINADRCFRIKVSAFERRYAFPASSARSTKRWDDYVSFCKNTDRGLKQQKKQKEGGAGTGCYMRISLSISHTVVWIRHFSTKCRKNWNVYWNPEMWWKSRLGAVTI